MLREVGYCAGIENYSATSTAARPGSPPWTLIDYFPPDYLLVIDESHMTIPQVRGMYGGDRSRKETLVDYGFRLPSALDNRPLSFEEFEARTGQVDLHLGHARRPYELGIASQVVEQIIRPTGLVDPEVEVRPVEGQVDDLVGEIRQRVEHGAARPGDHADQAHGRGPVRLPARARRSRCTTCTPRSRRWSGSSILRDLRLGVYDVVVGINLLREGLDLPEVSLVAILDADKEGFLRSDTALIQTIGRAARHVDGTVLMYADTMTDSMRKALDETNRRRAKQVAYNQAHGIEPLSIVKAVRDLTDQVAARAVAEPRGEYRALHAGGRPERRAGPVDQGPGEGDAGRRRGARVREGRQPARSDLRAARGTGRQGEPAAVAAGDTPWPGSPDPAIDSLP